MQPLDLETYLRTKRSSYFDEFNDVPQGSCFYEKKRDPKYLGPFKRPEAPKWLDEFVKFSLIQPPNLIDLRL